MKKQLLFILIFLIAFVKQSVYAAKNYQYEVYTPHNFESSVKPFDNSTKVLFIVDFSNSMNEKLGAVTKIDMALSAIENLLPKIPSNVQVGLRIYGHRAGFTYVDGCTASKLLVPLGVGNRVAIQGAMYVPRAKGWTPITYSLKQAVNSDFAGVTGEKRIILLTDGGENCDESPCTYAIDLMRARDDIKIDVIALDIYDAEANNQLRCTAFTTSGKFYTANTQEELKESLSESLNIDKEVKGTIRIREK